MYTFWSLILIISVLCVTFINGFTDAPNSIISVVATKALSFKKAAKLAAVCNLLGLVTITLINSSVINSINSIADFSGLPVIYGISAITASMGAILFFAVAAWYFGIPTSETHALIAALLGAALAAGGKLPSSKIWVSVLLGLGLSLFLGFISGFNISKLLERPLSRIKAKNLDRLQIGSAALAAFAHGAQDGQKFTAILIMAFNLLKRKPYSVSVDVKNHLFTLIATGLVIALGTRMGGRRIIHKVGEKTVHLEKPLGVSSDIACAVCLFAGTYLGIPMSSTHTKTSAIIGAGMSGKNPRVDYKSLGEILAAWVITFPACIVLAYVFTKLLIWLT